MLSNIVGSGTTSCSMPMRLDSQMFRRSSIAVPFQHRNYAVSGQKQSSPHHSVQCSAAQHDPSAQDQPAWRSRLASCLAAAALSAAIAVSPAAAKPQPFLTATGAQGPLREQEAELFRLREEAESEVRAELDRARTELEEEGRSTQVGKLCATPFGVDIVGITEFVALVGALVGGVTARQRKQELERLNDQLRKINTNLRQQARAGTMYAPGLTYIPAGALNTSSGPQPGAALPAAATAVMEPPVQIGTDRIPDAPEAPPTMKRAVAASLMSVDEDELSPESRQCLKALKEGKRLLKDKKGASALIHFEKALMLAKSLGNKVQERRAVRGLAAAARLQGQYAAAIKHLERVLEISNETQDHVGDADAYGTIADIYTDMGDFDRAAEFYDKYIDRMGADGPV